MGFYLYTGNRLEELADIFYDRVYSRKKSADQWLVPETVLIQTQGMGAWLKLALARRGEIAANLQFPFLNKFMESVLENVCGAEFRRGHGMMTRDIMMWRIFRIFTESPERYPELDSYFGGRNSGSELKKYQLASKVAELFDQYQIYHGDMLERWRTGEAPGEWQCRLYLELAGRIGGIDRFFGEFLARREMDPKHLPDCVSIFGVSSMAPVYFRSFVKLSKFCDVHFFYLNPSSDYWSDVLNAKQAGSLSRKTGKDRESLADGNPLLASFGVQGREFFRLMMELPELEITDAEECFHPFAETKNPTLLNRLQQSILENDAAPEFPAEKDGSVTIHNCHSPLREIEVLHDRLLALFQNPSIQPHDVIVMAPDISVYEPYINAVFGTGVLRSLYTFSDRSIRGSSRIASAFLQLLKLWKSKYEVTAVFDLLENPAVRKKWGMEETDPDRLRLWVGRAGIRWGIDAENRKELCDVSFEEYSWKQGLDRLLLGYAVLRGEEEQGNEEIIALDSAEGGDAVLLGNLIAFARALFALRKRFRFSRSLAEWSELLKETLEEFFENDDESYQELKQLRDALGRFRQTAEALALKEKLPPELILELLESHLGGLNIQEPFLRGKITFCSLVPMRSIPMKAVAILGLNDGEFPRRDFSSGFNLVPQEQRKMDRLPSQEDRYLFLESILAARKFLLLFYQGRDNRGKDRYPPALPLGELMDFLAAATGLRAEELEIEHPLQAFDSVYFQGTDAEKFSFSERDFLAAKQLAERLNGSAADASALPLRAVLPALPPADLPMTLELASLETFFLSPPAAYLDQMAGLTFPGFIRGELEDSEPLALDGLERYLLTQDIMRWSMEGIPEEEIGHILEKTGRLPVAGVGQNCFRGILRNCRTLPEVWRERMMALRETSLRVRVGSLELSADLVISSSGVAQHYCRYAAFKGKDAVKWYLRHLMLSLLHGEQAASFVWDHKEKKELFLKGYPKDAAAERMTELLHLYAAGQRRILPFFRNAAFAYANAGGGHDARIKAAQRAFYSKNFKTGGELGDYGEDRAVSLLFSPTDLEQEALAEEFAGLARTVFRPFAEGEVLHES